MQNLPKNTQNRVRLNQLDGIKGIICFFIIFVHYIGRTPSGAFPLAWMPDLFTKKGWIFVELFFIISGFLAAASSKHKIPETSFKNYVVSKLYRLYPPVLFITLFDVVVRIIGIIATHSTYRLTVFNLIKSLTFASTLIYNEEPFPTVLWYIHVLLLCYLLYFLIAKAKTTTKYYLGVAALLLLGWALYALQLDLPFLYKNIGRGYFSFAIGLLIFEFQNKASAKCRQTVTVLAAAISALALTLALIFGFGKVFGDILFCFTVLIFPTVMLCILNIPLLAKLFSLSPLVFLGKLSLATFLVHVPILNLFNIIYAKTGLLCLDNKLVFIIALATIMGVSLAWYYLIEQCLIPKLFKR